MKARTMAYFDPEQLEARQGPPLPPTETYLKIVALGSSDRQDISEHHDTYLGEALRRFPS